VIDIVVDSSAVVVLRRALGAAAEPLLDRFLKTARLVPLPIDSEQLAFARDARGSLRSIPPSRAAEPRRLLRTDLELVAVIPHAFLSTLKTCIQSLRREPGMHQSRDLLAVGGSDQRLAS